MKKIETRRGTIYHQEMPSKDRQLIQCFDKLRVLHQTSKLLISFNERII